MTKVTSLKKYFFSFETGHDMGPKKPTDGKAAPAAAKPKAKPVPKKPAEKKADGAAVEKVKKAKTVPHRKIHKAQRVQKKVVKGTHGTRIKKVRTSVHFHRPRTFRPARY